MRPAVNRLDNITRPVHTITPYGVEFRCEKLVHIRMEGRKSSIGIAKFVKSIVNGRLQSAPRPPCLLHLEGSSGLGQMLRSVPIIEERSVRRGSHFGPNDEKALVTHVSLPSRASRFALKPSILGRRGPTGWHGCFPPCRRHHWIPERRFRQEKTRRLPVRWVHARPTDR